MPTRRQFLYALIATAVLGAGVFLVLKYTTPTETTLEPTPTETVVDTPETPARPWQTMTPIGSSVEGRPIEAHTFGTGSTSLLFVGGIHGGYEWNSVVLAYELMDYLANFPETVPPELTIHIIPNLNPDGLAKVTAKTGHLTTADIPNPENRVAEGRFNARGVDLNRNFDCKWQPEATWKGKAVSAGTGAFSEPEAVSLRDYVLAHKPAAVLFWHSQADNVYASECEKGILPDTLTLMQTYARAGNYGAVASFDAYPVTGDAEGWLASQNIPAVTVELGSHTDSEWEQNLAATKAVFDLYRVAR